MKNPFAPLSCRYAHTILPKCFPTIKEVKEFYNGIRKKDDQVQDERPAAKEIEADSNQLHVLTNILSLATGKTKIPTAFHHLFQDLGANRMLQDLHAANVEEGYNDFWEMMMEYGFQTSTNSTVPFSPSRLPLEGPFMLDVVNKGVQRYVDKAFMLWFMDKEPVQYHHENVFLMIEMTLFNLISEFPSSFVMEQVEGLVADESTLKKTRILLSNLLLEAMMMRCYFVSFQALSEAEKQNPRNQVVHELFWNASFLFNQLWPKKWDRTYPECILDCSAKLRESEDLLRRATVYNVTCSCLERMLKSETVVRTLQRYTSAFQAEGDLPTVGIMNAKLQEVGPSLSLGELLHMNENQLATFEEAHHALDHLIFASKAILGDLDDAPAQQHEQNREAQPPAIAPPSPRAAEAQEHEDAVLQIDALLEFPFHAPPDAGEEPRAENNERLLSWIQETGVIDDVFDEDEVDFTNGPVSSCILGAMALEKQEDDDEVDAEEEEVESKDDSELEEKHILTKIKQMALGSASFRREVLAMILPEMEGLLEPTIECYVCLDPLSFAKDNGKIFYVTCCDGGKFICHACCEAHKKEDHLKMRGHPFAFETQIVAQTALIRSRMGFA